MAMEKGLVSAARGWPLAILLAVPPLYSELVPRVLGYGAGVAPWLKKPDLVYLAVVGFTTLPIAYVLIRLLNPSRWRAAGYTVALSGALIVLSKLAHRPSLVIGVLSIVIISVEVLILSASKAPHRPRSVAGMHFQYKMVSGLLAGTLLLTLGCFALIAPDIRHAYSMTDVLEKADSSREKIESMKARWVGELDLAMAGLTPLPNLYGVGLEPWKSIFCESYRYSRQLPGTPERGLFSFGCESAGEHPKSVERTALGAVGRSPEVDTAKARNERFSDAAPKHLEALNLGLMILGDSLIKARSDLSLNSVALGFSGEFGRRWQRGVKVNLGDGTVAQRRQFLADYSEEANRFLSRFDLLLAVEQNTWSSNGDLVRGEYAQLFSKARIIQVVAFMMTFLSLLLLLRLSHRGFHIRDDVHLFGIALFLFLGWSAQERIDQRAIDPLNPLEYISSRSRIFSRFWQTRAAPMAIEPLILGGGSPVDLGSMERDLKKFGALLAELAKLPSTVDSGFQAGHAERLLLEDLGRHLTAQLLEAEPPTEKILRDDSNE